MQAADGSGPVEEVYVRPRWSPQPVTLVGQPELAPCSDRGSWHSGVRPGEGRVCRWVEESGRGRGNEAGQRPGGCCRGEVGAPAAVVTRVAGQVVCS